MNKTHLIEKVARDTGVSKVLADQMIDSFIGCVMDSLKREEKVTIKDFGTWEVSKRKARNGRNPQNGTPIIIKEKKRARFTPGKRLDSAINRELRLKQQH